MACCRPMIGAASFGRRLQPVGHSRNLKLYVPPCSDRAAPCCYLRHTNTVDIVPSTSCPLAAKTVNIKKLAKKTIHYMGCTSYVIHAIHSIHSLIDMQKQHDAVTSGCVSLLLWLWWLYVCVLPACCFNVTWSVMHGIVNLNGLWKMGRIWKRNMKNWN